MTWPDVVIAGGGIIGAACARALARRGVSVTVIEPGPLDGAATAAAAGMLAPFAEAEPDDPMFGFAVRARDATAEIAQQLEQETGVAVGLWTEGILRVALDDTRAEQLRDAVAWQRQRGFAVEWLDAEEVRERLPGISDEAVGAAVALEDGGLRPGPYREALLASAARGGARVITGERVTALKTAQDRVIGLETDGGAHVGGAVVVAAGCWSGKIAGLPRPLSVEPIRGQMAALDWPKGEPPAIVLGEGGYVVQRAGEALAGSTMEHAGFDPTVTDDGLRHIYRVARSLYPALDERSVKRTWAGLRPGTPDGRPILGPDPDVQGLWYATGHGRNGILLATLTGEVLADLYTGEVIELDLAPMAPHRFWNA